jgi:glucose-1-phosphate thymidylyltransferase
MPDHTRPLVVGIVPAAGRATRLPHRTGSKELIPINDRAIAEYLVDAMVAAGADQLVIVIAPDKQDIAAHFGTRTRHGVPITYLEQLRPTGMSDAIDLAYSYLHGRTVLMGMPDTIVDPPNSLALVRAAFEACHADIGLALAPTEEPERLGPVDVDRTGRVERILDKPAVAPHNTVWTVACWTARFTDYLHAHLAAGPRLQPEAPLGLIFQAALDDGFFAHALTFPDGRYIDAGTPAGLEKARQFAARAAVSEA